MNAALASKSDRPVAARAASVSHDDQEPSDGELLLAFRQGDAMAFNTLVRRYQRPVYRLALRYARDLDEAHDLTQRTFLRVLNHANSLQLDQSFRAFLFRVAANLCKNHLRDRAKLIFNVPFTAAAPEDSSLEDKEQRSQLRASLAQLPLRQRQVVSLRIDAELPFAEIGQSLGISENNAKVSFHHAVKHLRLMLKQAPT